MAHFFLQRPVEADPRLWNAFFFEWHKKHREIQKEQKKKWQDINRRSRQRLRNMAKHADAAATENTPTVVPHHSLVPIPHTTTTTSIVEGNTSSSTNGISTTGGVQQLVGIRPELLLDNLINLPPGDIQMLTLQAIQNQVAGVGPLPNGMAPTAVVGTVPNTTTTTTPTPNIVPIIQGVPSAQHPPNADMLDPQQMVPVNNATMNMLGLAQLGALGTIGITALGPPPNRQQTTLQPPTFATVPIPAATAPSPTTTPTTHTPIVVPIAQNPLGTPSPQGKQKNVGKTQNGKFKGGVTPVATVPPTTTTQQQQHMTMPPTMLTPPHNHPTVPQIPQAMIGQVGTVPQGQAGLLKPFVPTTPQQPMPGLVNVATVPNTTTTTATPHSGGLVVPTVGGFQHQHQHQHQLQLQQQQHQQQQQPPPVPEPPVLNNRMKTNRNSASNTNKSKSAVTTTPQNTISNTTQPNNNNIHTNNNPSFVPRNHSTPTTPPVEPVAAPLSTNEHNNIRGPPPPPTTTTTTTTTTSPTGTGRVPVVHNTKTTPTHLTNGIVNAVASNTNNGYNNSNVGNNNGVSQQWGGGGGHQIHHQQNPYGNPVGQQDPQVASKFTVDENINDEEIQWVSIERDPRTGQVKAQVLDIMGFLEDQDGES